MFWTPFLLLLYINFANGKSKDVRMILLKEYRGCAIDLPFVQGISVKVAGRGILSMSGDLNITEDIGNITLIQVRVERCKSAADVESCEYYTTAKYRNPCPMIMAKGQMWSEPFDHVVPRLTCPMNKGQYVLTNATIDSSKFASFPGLDGWYWKGKIKIFRDDTLVSCFKMGAAVERVRMRDG